MGIQEVQYLWQRIEKPTGPWVGILCRKGHQSDIDRPWRPKEGSDSVIKVCTCLAARVKPKLN